MPSLYLFSAVDAASAVDYSRELNIDDGVVNSPPPKLVARAYAPSPSPLSKEKRTHVRLAHSSPSRDDGITRRGPIRRLRMDASPRVPSPVHSAPPFKAPVVFCPPVGISSPVVENAVDPPAPVAPVVAALVDTVPRVDVPKAKVPFLNPQNHLLSLAMLVFYLYVRSFQTALLVFSHSISTFFCLLVICRSFAGVFPPNWCAHLHDVLG